MYWCNPWGNITVRELGIAVRWIFKRFQNVSVGGIQFCTKDMFGSRFKTGRFIVRIRTSWEKTIPFRPCLPDQSKMYRWKGFSSVFKDMFGSGPKPRYFGQDPDRR
jgi:hypothetical protein